MKDKMETINLNGKEYILKEEFDQLKQSESKQLEKKKEGQKVKLFNYLITDKNNVMAIVPRERGGKELGEEFNLNCIGTGDGKDCNWKLVDNDLIIPQIKGFSNKFEKYKISKTLYSKEMIDQSIKTSKAFGYGASPEIFMLFDKDKNEFIEDNLCLIIFERSLVFVLAPRVETDEN
jgi:hypothetical protein